MMVDGHAGELPITASPGTYQQAWGHFVAAVESNSPGTNQQLVASWMAAVIKDVVLGPREAEAKAA